MKIRKLELKNIGAFNDETIEFRECPEGKAEIHIFTGQNGSGKTTILQGLASIFNSYLSPDPLYRNPTGLVWGNDINLFSKRFHHIFDDPNYLNSYLTVLLKVQNVNHLNLETMVFAEPQTGEITGYDKVGSLREYRSVVSSYKGEELSFAVFAYSAYRQVQSEPIEALKEPKNFNPLSQSLDFVKDYNQTNQLKINQLIANNISKSAIEKGRNEEKSKKFANVIRSIQQAISEITGLKVEFDLETEPTDLITKINGEELDFDVLPDGLRSLISWIADLLGRVDLLKWQDDLPIFEKNLILLLDEIEVHLHPAWQRKVLPVVQKLFKNSQIFVSTHSPFVVNSIDDAWVYKLELNEGKARVASVERSEDARSYRYVLRNTFDIENEFGIEIERRLKDFYDARDSLLAGNGNSKKAKAEIKKIAKELSAQSKELKSKIDFELFQLSEATGEKF